MLSGWDHAGTRALGGLGLTSAMHIPGYASLCKVWYVCCALLNRRCISGCAVQRQKLLLTASLVAGSPHFAVPKHQNMAEADRLTGYGQKPGTVDSTHRQDSTPGAGCWWTGLSSAPWATVVFRSIFTGLFICLDDIGHRHLRDSTGSIKGLP
jgi:hypothetical protein